MWRHRKAGGGVSLSVTVVFVVIYLLRLVGIENLLLTDLFAVLGLAAITIFYLILDLRYDSGLRSTSK
jgi:hypothetical protein